MKFPVYTYRDKKTAFGAPVIDQNDPAAIRGFAYAINSQNGIMNYSPDDFELYKIGEFDSDKGILIALDIPVFITDGNAVFDKE